MLLQGGQAHDDWKAWQNDVRRKFSPQDSVRQFREKLCALEQNTSVSDFLNDFRNIFIAIPGISKDKNIDNLCVGLRPQIRMKVVKAGPENVDTAAWIYLKLTLRFMRPGCLEVDPNMRHKRSLWISGTLRVKLIIKKERSKNFAEEKKAKLKDK